MLEKVKNFIAGKKAKATALVMTGTGMVLVGLNQTNAVLFSGSGVSLENSDLTTIQNGAQFGVNTQFESFKLIGIVMLIGASTWLITKVFSSIKIGGQ